MCRGQKDYSVCIMCAQQHFIVQNSWGSLVLFLYGAFCSLPIEKKFMLIFRQGSQANFTASSVTNEPFFLQQVIQSCRFVALKSLILRGTHIINCQERKDGINSEPYCQEYLGNKQTGCKLRTLYANMHSTAFVLKRDV